MRAVYDAEFLERCQGFLRNPGISVVRDAQVALEAGTIHAMHDPTEGGLAAALWELAQASGRGLRFDPAAVPVKPAPVSLLPLWLPWNTELT